jgi:hypothetical protein
LDLPTILVLKFRATSCELRFRRTCRRPILWKFCAINLLCDGAACTLACCSLARASALRSFCVASFHCFLFYAALDDYCLEAYSLRNAIKVALDPAFRDRKIIGLCRAKQIFNVEVTEGAKKKNAPLGNLSTTAEYKAFVSLVRVLCFSLIFWIGCAHRRSSRDRRHR